MNDDDVSDATKTRGDFSFVDNATSFKINSFDNLQYITSPERVEREVEKLRGISARLQGTHRRDTPRLGFPFKASERNLGTRLSLCQLFW